MTVAIEEEALVIPNVVVVDVVVVVDETEDPSALMLLAAGLSFGYNPTPAVVVRVSLQHLDLSDTS